MHAGEIEVILSRYFSSGNQLMVPNVSYGLNIHEVDMLLISLSGYCTEIEIKISIADLKADLKKSHGHKSNKIKYFYFAVPIELKDKALELIPERAGLITIQEPDKVTRFFPYVNIVKPPVINKLARKLTEKELLKLGYLASLRIWSLKECIYKLTKTISGLKRKINL